MVPRLLVCVSTFKSVSVVIWPTSVVGLELLLRWDDNSELVTRVYSSLCINIQQILTYGWS